MIRIDKTYKLLAPAHLVRISFDTQDDGRGSAAFSCVPCDEELLRWYPDHSLWLCPGCEQELHLDEADWVIRRSEVAFGKLKDELHRKQGRGLRNWWRRLWAPRR